MNLFRIDRAEESFERLQLFHTNAPFAISAVLLTALVLVAIAVHRSKAKKWMRSEREKMAIEFGVPLVCLMIVVGISFKDETVIVGKDSPDLIHIRRNLLGLLWPDVTVIPIRKISAVRVDGMDYQVMKSDMPAGRTKTNHSVSLRFGREHLRLAVGNSTDRDDVLPWADRLAAFIQRHPDHEPQGFSDRR